jgi:hypothetical protein
MPLTPALPIETGVIVRGAGVCPLETDLLPSPNLTSASTALSTLPSALFNTSEFLLLSLNPISLNVASLASKLLLPTPVIFMPNS